MTAQEQFRRAAELIEEHGHCQMRWSGRNGEMCMTRALATAVDLDVGEENYANMESELAALFQVGRSQQR